MNPVAQTLEQHKKANRKITAATGKMAELYRQARERLNAELQKFVLSGGNPSDGKWLVELINELERNYGQLEKAFVAEMKRTIPYVAEGYYFDALHDLGHSVIGQIDRNKIELLQHDAFNHVAGMTRNMLKSDVAFIRQAAADVFRLAGTSAMTAEQTKQMLLGKILMRPEKFRFVDAGGRVWDNEAYCKMLSRTVLLNAGRQTYFDACAANGDDVVRVTVSGNPCPACAVWENRLLSISGATEGLPTVAQATAAGLCHPNCTHSFVAVGKFAQQEDFTADGRPKAGVNSPGREEKDDKEAWKKYRNSLKPKKAKKGPSAASKRQSAPPTPETTKPATKATEKPAKGTPAAVQPELPLSGTGIQQNQPLTNVELNEVREYTKSQGFVELNDYLRKEKGANPDLDRKAEHLNRAIQKSITSEPVVLWRGVVDNPELIKGRENGLISEIDVKGFQSTSRSFDIACGFAGNDGRSAVVFKITVPKGKHALDVSAVSHNPDEQEVLLPSIGKYRVDKVYYEKDDDGFIIRQIVEVTYE